MTRGILLVANLDPVWSGDGCALMKYLCAAVIQQLLINAIQARDFSGFIVAQMIPVKCWRTRLCSVIRPRKTW